MILAGVTISSLTGENGLLAKAKEAKITQMKAEAKDNIEMAIMEIQVEESKQGIETTHATLNAKLESKNSNIQVNEYIDGEKEITGTYLSGKTTFEYIIDENLNVIIGDIIKDGETKFAIDVTNITLDSIDVTANTTLIGFTPVEFTYVANTTTGTKQEFPNITATSYTVTGLTPGTEYMVYMIAYDNAGNEKKSKTKLVTTDKIPDGTKLGAITFAAPTWTTGTANVAISTTTSYQIEYQINGTTDESWTTGNNVTGINHGDTIYARLTNGTYSGMYTTLTVIDNVAPIATISLSSTTATTSKTITADVTLTDNETGVDLNNSKWIYNTQSSAMGTDISKYTESFTSLTQTIDLKVTTANTYYVHILVTDKAGNKQEKISSSITVTSPPAEIGGLVHYNVTYTDMYTGYEFTADNGWRILEKGTQNADGTYTGTKIISTGIPANLYYYYSTIASASWGGTGTNYNNKAANGLINNFTKVTFTPGTTSTTTTQNMAYYRAINGKTTGTLYGTEFISTDAECVGATVHNLTLAELNTARGNSSTDTTSTATKDGGVGLFYLRNLGNYGYSTSISPYYWLASPYPSSTINLYRVYDHGSISTNDGGSRGVRPVVSLPSNFNLEMR